LDFILLSSNLFPKNQIDGYHFNKDVQMKNAPYEPAHNQKKTKDWFDFILNEADDILLNMKCNCNISNGCQLPA
jgi:hypothetical protein